MKKIIIKLSVTITAVLVIIFIYSIFIKVEMSSATKIICKYFENIEADKPDKIFDTSGMEINNSGTYLDEADKYPIIKYEDSFYQFAGYMLDKEAVYTEKNIDLCYIVDREDIDIEKSVTKNAYELKNISSKYAFSYKNEGRYYLYVWLNVNGDTDIISRMGNFDEVFSEINRNGDIDFYSIRVSIYTRRNNTYSDKSFRCYGDINSLLDRHIIGKELQNMGNILPERKTLTNITQYKKYKEAAISIWGYMKDVKSIVLLSISSDGYLRLGISDIWIDTCFWIDDAQIEMICQDILENFEVYSESERTTKIDD